MLFIADKWKERVGDRKNYLLSLKILVLIERTYCKVLSKSTFHLGSNLTLFLTTPKTWISILKVVLNHQLWGMFEATEGLTKLNSNSVVDMILDLQHCPPRPSFVYSLINFNFFGPHIYLFNLWWNLLCLC